MKPVVQGSSAIQDRKNELEQQAKKAKEEVKRAFVQNQKLFEEQKKEMEEKVAKRPLLVEQGEFNRYVSLIHSLVTIKNQKMQVQAMHDLNKLNKIMKEAGVRDPGAYFTQDEKDKIEDAKFLEKHGFKEFNQQK